MKRRNKRNEEEGEKEKECASPFVVCFVLDPFAPPCLGMQPITQQSEINVTWTKKQFLFSQGREASRETEHSTSGKVFPDRRLWPILSTELGTWVERW